MNLARLTIVAFPLVLFLLALGPSAQAEVTLRLMTWVGYSPESQVQEFEKAMSVKYGKPVKLKIHYINGYDEAFTLLRRGEADVIVLVSHILNDARFQFIANKLISPIDLTKVPHFKSVRKEYETHVKEKGVVYATPIASGPYGLAYNKKYFTEPPTSWNVLWDPKYAGQYAITNGIFEVNLYVTALAMGYAPNSFGEFETLNNPEFKAKLRALVENCESFWPGIDEAHHLQGLQLATSWGFSIPTLRDLGEDWEMAEPSEGSPAWIDVHTIRQSMSKEPLKMDLAHEWINYTLSPEFQVKVIAEGIETPPVTTSAVAKLSPKQRQAFHVDNEDFLKKHRVYYPTITSERTRNGLKLIWQEANRGITKAIKKKP